MRSFSKVVSAAAFMLLSAVPVSAAAGTIMEPKPKASFCNAMPLNYPGFLPEYLDMNADYAKAYQSSADDYFHNYALYLTSLTSRALLSSEQSGKLVAELVKVAESRPITWPRPNDPPHFHEMLVLMPYTVAYAHVKSSMTEGQQKLVESWIKSRIKLLSKGLPEQKTNNRVYHYGAILAAFGYATGESAYSKKAYGIYTTAIKKQRDDGSLMQDSERGGSALHYTNQAIGNLVALAEILQSSGYDTYGYELKGRSLHTIVQFLLAAGSNPALIKGYAEDNPEYSQFQFPGSSPDNQDMGWKRSVIISWAYFYMARFPDHPNTKGLMSISPFLRSGQVGEPDIATGNARCYLGQ
jgi:poly(beta-D-mannuronate) lyase